MNSLRAELTILARRPAIWVLLTVGVVLNLFVGYIAPYISYIGAEHAERSQVNLDMLLPNQLLANVLEGFPFYVAMFGLILGVIVLGSEFSQGTLKAVLIQHPGRIQWLFAKLGAISIALFAFTLAVGLTAGGASVVIALSEGVSIDWPSAGEISRGIGAGWLILLLWSFFGATLAILTRGTSMAIGLGILYGLVVEGLVSAFGTDISLLHELSHGFLRANGYSLIVAFGGAAPTGGEPGAFSGPLNDAWLATFVIIGYLVIFAGLSASMLRIRDVT